MRSTSRGQRTLPPLAMAAYSDGHLHRRHRHFALADANVGRIAVVPVGLCTRFKRRENARGFLPGRQVRALAKMKFLGHADDVLDARAQADGDEIGVAGVNDGAPEIVFARRRQIRDVPPPDIDITRIVHRVAFGSRPASSAARPTMGLKMEPGA